MKITIPQEITEPTKSVMQKLGYFENYDHRTGKTSYIKRLSREMFYPRFHVYIDEMQNNRVINLHLDQKRPSYAGAAAHNAEYDSEPVKREIERLREILSKIKAVPYGNTNETGERKGGILRAILRMFGIKK